MYRFSISGLIILGLLFFTPPAFAGKTCKDGITPKSTGCPLDFSEQLVAFDNFDNGLDGWSGMVASEPVCGGDPMLVFAPNPGGSSSREYVTLPEHNFVRIQATAYFTDDWQGEAATLALDAGIVWVEQHDQRSLPNATSVCGNSVYPESKLGVPIDITVPHSAATLDVSVSTTLPGFATAALALDDVRVSVFTYAP